MALSITPANVIAQAGARKVQGISGATLTAGLAVYKDPDDNTWKKTIVTESQVGVGGITLNGASSGQPVTILTEGDIAIGATMVQGAVYVASAVAGTIGEQSDITTNDYTTIIGVAKTTAILSVKLNGPYLYDP